MTFAPATLRRLGAYWTEQGGVNLGIVGDANHNAGYHLGKDRIYAPAGLGGADYSVQLRRDQDGLSEAASAIDLGRLDGSLPALYTFSAWLVDRARAGEPGTRDIREVIYSPDGQKVQRYSGVDQQIHTGPGNGDASHLAHTHISYFRDSEARDKVVAFAPYFAGGDMALDVPSSLTSDWRIHLKVGVRFYNDAACTQERGKVSVEQDAVYIGIANTGRCVKLLTGGEQMGVYVKSSDVAPPVKVETPPPGPIEPDAKHSYQITFDGAVDAGSLSVTMDGAPVE